jgi:hypothetical protein
MAKTDIKICGYEDCPHPGREINITVDDYSKDGRRYFHTECLEKKKKREVKNEQQKADLQYIKNLWVQHISNTVDYGQLFFVLNGFVVRGINTDYLVFVVRYVIDNNLNLRYPGGLKYFVDNQEIKDAYARSKIQKIKQSEFHAKTDGNDTAPEFTLTKKEHGFHTILGGK